MKLLSFFLVCIMLVGMGVYVFLQKEYYFTPCSHFAEISHAEAVYREFSKTISTEMSIDTTTCPNKAGFIFFVPTANDKNRIFEIIQSRFFIHSVPYKFQNI